MVLARPRLCAVLREMGENGHGSPTQTTWTRVETRCFPQELHLVNVVLLPNEGRMNS